MKGWGLIKRQLLCMYPLHLPSFSELKIYNIYDTSI